MNRAQAINMAAQWLAAAETNAYKWIPDEGDPDKKLQPDPAWPHVFATMATAYATLATTLPEIEYRDITEAERDRENAAAFVDRATCGPVHQRWTFPPCDDGNHHDCVGDMDGRGRYVCDCDCHGDGASLGTVGDEADAREHLTRAVREIGITVEDGGQALREALSKYGYSTPQEATVGLWCEQCRERVSPYRANLAGGHVMDGGITCAGPVVDLQRSE